MSFSMEADAAVTFARTGAPGTGARGVTAFLVDLNEKGVTRTRFEDLGSKIVAPWLSIPRRCFRVIRVPAGRGG